MNPEIKRKWVSALRSGTYRQGQGKLRLADNFCCLGVLCEISAKGDWYQGKYLGEKNFLPKEVLNWSELREHSPKVPAPVGDIRYREWMATHGEQVTITAGKVDLAALNDMGFTFREIAEMIERSL